MNLFSAHDDAPFVRGSATSHAAAADIESVSGQLRRAVLTAVRNLGGATCDECEVELDMRHQTCSARIRELAKAGLIIDSGTTRRTRSGRGAVVWVAAK